MTRALNVSHTSFAPVNELYMHESSAGPSTQKSREMHPAKVLVDWSTYLRPIGVLNEINPYLANLTHPALFLTLSYDKSLARRRLAQ